MNYAPLHKAYQAQMKLKVGDTVKVMRKPTGGSEIGESGWDMWIDEMNRHVGKTKTIDSIDADDGVFCTDGYVYPIFILEKIASARPSFKLDDGYTAKIEEDGSLTVGCQHLPYALVQKIAAASKKANDANK